MAGTSKTARAATKNSTKATAFQRAGDAPLVTSLGGGTHARVFAISGKTVTAPVGSEAFTAAVAELRTASADLASRVERELTALDDRFPGNGWAAALATAEETTEAA